jgi:hypothetical protein
VRRRRSQQHRCQSPLGEQHGPPAAPPGLSPQPHRQPFPIWTASGVAGAGLLKATRSTNTPPLGAKGLPSTISAVLAWPATAPDWGCLRTVPHCPLGRLQQGRVRYAGRCLGSPPEAQVPAPWRRHRRWPLEDKSAVAEFQLSLSPRRGWLCTTAATCTRCFKTASSGTVTKPPASLAHQRAPGSGGCPAATASTAALAATSPIYKASRNRAGCPALR